MARRRRCRSTASSRSIPAMPNLHRLYQAGQAIVVHAVATPYRERSHFDGQDVLESGFARPGRADTGWLNRALAGLAPGDRVRAGTNRARAFAVGPITPLVVRGPAPVLSWVPPRLPPVSDDTTMRLLDLYRHTDPTLARVLEDRIDLARSPCLATRRVGTRARGPGGSDRKHQPGARILRRGRRSGGEVPGEPRRPACRRARARRLGHPCQRRCRQRPAVALLGALDAAIAAIETNMGGAWSETVVALVTEFGRTARINGTDGTDHGTATVALLAGGALKGGRVDRRLAGCQGGAISIENRDLKPTTDLRAVLKGLLRDHLRVEERALMTDIFPDSDDVKPIEGCLA